MFDNTTIIAQGKPETSVLLSECLTYCYKYGLQTTGNMNSLADTYGNGSIGSDGGGRRRPLAIGLIVAGAILILVGAIMLFGSVGSGATPYLIAGVLGGLALPAVLVGVVATLQTSPELRVIAAIGGSLTILGVTLFWYAYPGQWGTFGNNPAGYAIVSYLLGMILICGSILAGAMLRQGMRQTSGLGGSSTTHTGSTSASTSQSSQTYTTANTSQAQQWDGGTQTVTTSDGGTVERRIKEVDTIGTSSSSNSQSRAQSQRGSMSSSPEVDKITTSGQSQRETQKKQPDEPSQQSPRLDSPDRSTSTTERQQVDAVPDSRDRWVEKGKQDTTTFDQGAGSTNTNEQSGNTGSTFGSTAEVFGSSRQQTNTDTGPATNKNIDASQVGSSKDRARSGPSTANSRETSGDSTTTESESTGGIDIIAGEDQTETTESTSSSQTTGAAPTQTNSSPAQLDTENTSTSRWSPDSPLGDPIPEDRKPDLADRYCGNCAYFGYGDSGVQPHCQYHNEDLSDMEACHDWQPNSKRN